MFLFFLFFLGGGGSDITMVSLNVECFIFHTQDNYYQYHTLMLMFQGTVDSVGNLIKRHEDFENTLIVQEERLQGLEDIGSKLIKAGHYSKD